MCKQNIQYSYDFVVFLLCGVIGIAKKGKIDLWHLAMLGIGSVRQFIKTHTRSKNTNCKVNNSFMFKFVLLKPSLLQLIVMMKSTTIHFKQFLIAA
jgi:hypothetical protein